MVTERSPVDRASATHYRVRPGDTLYSIAYRYHLDVPSVASANGLSPPYTIYPGQKLRLKAVPGESGDTGRAPPTRPAKRRDTGKIASPDISWRWPSSGRIVKEYGRENPGLDFELNGGARIVTAAPGEVVYSGNGLGGYLRLVIVRHGDEYLSAYSINAEVRVSEGDRLSRRAVIADLSSTLRRTQSMHFEIRKRGEPVSPRSLLGKR
ncbi:MAG: peptidoglycan DD-metalloendopeptidase family protein [Pseudomonadales bacterium]|nr:peptidoglycan DD-metalloendopeptidase family protein [Pseudomonadales bacterium]